MLEMQAPLRSRHTEDLYYENRLARLERISKHIDEANPPEGPYTQEPSSPRRRESRESPSPFFKLPPEIRVAIYRYALAGTVHLLRVNNRIAHIDYTDAPIPASALRAHNAVPHPSKYGWWRWWYRQPADARLLLDDRVPADFADEDPTAATDHQSLFPRRRPLSLLLTCRALHTEAAPVLYAATAFETEALDVLREVARRTPHWPHVTDLALAAASPDPAVTPRRALFMSSPVPDLVDDAESLAERLREWSALWEGLEPAAVASVPGLRRLTVFLGDRFVKRFDPPVSRAWENAVLAPLRRLRPREGFHVVLYWETKDVASLDFFKKHAYPSVQDGPFQLLRLPTFAQLETIKEGEQPDPDDERVLYVVSTRGLYCSAAEIPAQARY
jgi:hypothetical protein